MTISLIVPTYRRPVSICRLLESIETQTVIPERIIIVDSSEDENTRECLEQKEFSLPLTYLKVIGENKGSVQQRNYGIELLKGSADIISFLDDDLVLEPDFFELLIKTFKSYQDAIGVGGIDMQSNHYVKKVSQKKYGKFHYFEFDGWVRPDPLRNRVRKLVGLMPKIQPGIIPDYSHGRSSLPPSGGIYNVEHLMGGIAAFKSDLFSFMRFSDYFKGYGLYEDFDFCVRALKYGRLYVNTNAKVWHYHEPSGRPNSFKYGKMVVRNGWYVWRVRFPEPTIKARFKWHATTLLLATIRFLNIITGPNRQDAMYDFAGRILAWFGVLITPPKRID